MKKQMTLVALGATLVLAGNAIANIAGEKPVRGKITEVSKDPKNPNAVDLVITAGGKNNPHTVTVVVDDTAQVTVDGAPAKYADLTEGERVLITPGTGIPRTVEAITKGHKFGETAAATQPAAPATQPSASSSK